MENKAKILWGQEVEASIWSNLNTAFDDQVPAVGALKLKLEKIDGWEGLGPSEEVLVLHHMDQDNE